MFGFFQGMGFEVWISVLELDNGSGTNPVPGPPNQYKPGPAPPQPVNTIRFHIPVRYHYARCYPQDEKRPVG